MRISDWSSDVCSSDLCVADIIGAGIIPGGMEMMDRPAIKAAEAFVRVGYPLDVEALLLVELDGPQVEVDDLIGRVRAIAERHGAVSLRVSESEEERLQFWAGRKAAFPAIGRPSPRSAGQTSELQSLMRLSYAVFS